MQMSVVGRALVISNGACAILDAEMNLGLVPRSRGDALGPAEVGPARQDLDERGLSRQRLDEANVEAVGATALARILPGDLPRDVGRRPRRNRSRRGDGSGGSGGSGSSGVPARQLRFGFLERGDARLLSARRGEEDAVLLG